MDHLKKYISIKFSNTPKYITECYTCRKREIENTCKKCFIFKGNRYSLTNFRKQITYYTTLQKLIYSHTSYRSAMGLRVVYK